MIDFSTLALFSGACLALTVTPGPDMLLIASRSVSGAGVPGLRHWRASMPAPTCHALAAALGLSQLFLAVPIAYDAVRFAGAAYLLTQLQGHSSIATTSPRPAMSIASAR